MELRNIFELVNHADGLITIIAVFYKLCYGTHSSAQGILSSCKRIRCSLKICHSVVFKKGLLCILKTVNISPARLQLGKWGGEGESPSVVRDIKTRRW